MKHTPINECKMCHSIENGHRSIVLGYGVICDNCIPKLRKIGNAAPDLLEACKGMLEWAKRVKGNNPGMEVFNAINAISKAEGRE